MTAPSVREATGKLEEALGHLAVLERALEGQLAHDDTALLEGLRLLLGQIVNAVGKAQDCLDAFDKVTASEARQ